MGPAKTTETQSVMEQTGPVITAAVDWSSYLREVCVVILSEQTETIVGEGKTTEIEEVKIGKRKYNRGHVIERNWVFRGIECKTKHCFFHSSTVTWSRNVVAHYNQVHITGFNSDQ